MKETIDYGDTVLLHIGFDSMVPIITKKGGANQTKFGHLYHDRIVGKKYGSRHQGTKGWLQLLHPTPELWTLCLPHRTQILYSTDISMIILQLDLKPGSIVVESGTGSGSLSHSFIRTIQPTGHLHTYEFHEERSKKAREEFEQHGLAQFVTVTHRDACEDGFQLEGIADAVFLDLPRPWETITSAKAAIKKEGGRICSFSPCIEQVQKTCEALSDHGFAEITTLEVLQRNFNMNYAKMQTMSMGDDDVAEDNKIAKEAETDSSVTSAPEVIKKDNDTDTVVDESESCTPAKVQKKDRWQANNYQKQKPVSNFSFDSAVPQIQMQGHTGFLTFASLFSN